ncbi:uncharacterized protein LOC117109052 [Anneissia japonica]|uniref:uncharacterized protein LOC117109052 n=1 Tax=Anneissia japonica TaxID=1529436 RepID=UPI001425B46D|nr:uncharacterized protein LOC117109052 [Anneissia japonica]
MASKRFGRNFHIFRTKYSSSSLPNLEDLIFSQKALINTIGKLKKNIHDMSTLSVEWSKSESNQAFYDVFTNWVTLDNVLCLFINDLHNQCTEVCLKFKMIKEKHKFINSLRKKKEAKTTEVRRLRKKKNTLKWVRQRGDNDTLEFELTKALADLDEVTATLRTEINNFEITKARTIKDALTTYSQGWLKFSADSQNIFTAQYQIASEMSGKPERQHYKSMDVNKLIVNNALQKMNLTIPELESPDSRRSTKAKGLNKGRLSLLNRRSTRSLPNTKDSSPDLERKNEREALPDKDFSNINIKPEKEPDRVDVYEPVNIGYTTTDRDDNDEDPIYHSVACRTNISVPSLVEDESSGGSLVEDDDDDDDDYNYVIPNSYKDKGIVSAQISQTDSEIVEEEKDNEIYAVYIGLSGMNYGECCKDAQEDQDKDKHCHVLDKSDSVEPSANYPQSIGNDPETSRSIETTSSRQTYKANSPDTVIKEAASNIAANSSKQPGDEAQNKGKKPPIKEKPIRLRGTRNVTREVKETKE